MPPSPREESGAELCASCGNPVALCDAYYRNMGTDGPYHRLCVPSRNEDCQGEAVESLTLTKRRAPILQVIKGGRTQ